MGNTYDIRDFTAHVEDKSLEKAVAELLERSAAVHLQALANAIREGETAAVAIFMADIIRKFNSDAEEIQVEEHVAEQKAEFTAKRELEYQNAMYEASVL